MHIEQQGGQDIELSAENSMSTNGDSIVTNTESVATTTSIATVSHNAPMSSITTAIPITKHIVSLRPIQNIAQNNDNETVNMFDNSQSFTIQDQMGTIETMENSQPKVSFQSTSLFHPGTNTESISECIATNADKLSNSQSVPICTLAATNNDVTNDAKPLETGVSYIEHHKTHLQTNEHQVENDAVKLEDATSQNGATNNR